MDLFHLFVSKVPSIFTLDLLNKFANACDDSVKLYQVVDLAFVPFAWIDSVKYIKHFFHVRKTFQLILDYVLDPLVLDKILKKVQSFSKRLYILKRLLHPSLKASSPKSRLTLVQNLIQGRSRRNDFFLHVFWKNVQGVQACLIKLHEVLILKETERKLLLVSLFFFNLELN